MSKQVFLSESDAAKVVIGGIVKIKPVAGHFITPDLGPAVMQYLYSQGARLVAIEGAGPLFDHFAQNNSRLSRNAAAAAPAPAAPAAQQQCSAHPGLEIKRGSV